MDAMTAYPPEVLLDESNPANDRYYTHLQELRGAVNAAAARLRPRQAEVVRMYHQGTTPKDIAEATGYKRTTVYNIIKRPEAQELLVALRFTQQLVDGPNLELRRNMLWRIAQRSEDQDPTTSIAALKELNKLAGAYPVQAPQIATVTNITINNEALPRTKLDD